MKTKTYFLLLIALTLLQSCDAQKTNKILKVENHLNDHLDYTHQELELVQKQQNGEEIVFGTIKQDGTIVFNMKDFDIKALYDGIPLQPQNFFQQFLMNGDCKDRDVFAETPFKEAYAQKFDPIFIKKYGENVAVLFPATDEKMFKNNHYYRSNNYDGKELTLGSKFYWFYMDRDIAFTDNCVKNLQRIEDGVELSISADIQLKKGWNFIEEKLVETQKFSDADYHTTLPKSIQFTNSTISSKKAKWYLIQIIKENRLEAVKRAFEMEPITTAQFESWIPEKAGDFTRTSYELDKALEQSGSTKNNVFVVFENGDQKMELAILDGAKNPKDLEMANFSFAMDEEYKRDDKPATDASLDDTVAKGEPHHISKEDPELKTAQIMAVFKDRIVLYASGENITAVQLWEAIKTIEIGSIIK